jgi:hypothetical protein
VLGGDWMTDGLTANALDLGDVGRRKRLILCVGRLDGSC